MEAEKFGRFYKIWKGKKSKICVIFARNHGWPRNCRGWSKTRGGCALRPGPKTATAAISVCLSVCLSGMIIEYTQTRRTRYVLFFETQVQIHEVHDMYLPYVVICLLTNK